MYKIVLQKYLAKLKTYSPLRFILEMAVAAYVLKILGSVVVIKILYLFFGNSSIIFSPQLTVYTNQTEQNAVQILFNSLILAPVTETIMAQSLGAFIFADKPFIAIMFSTLVFTYLHWIKQLPFIGIFFVGLVLSFAYVFIQKNNSTCRAFLITSGIHATHNLITIVLQRYFLN